MNSGARSRRPDPSVAEVEDGPTAAAGRLLELTVTDLALLERLRLELGPGLNVVTGETGAGKSLVIDALGLVLGARADPGLVRHGSSVARVEALFDRLPEPLIVVREVTAAGRSTARLDDEAVTAARLGETVGPLVEIHGQHDQQRLLDERWQRELLDAAGGHADVRAALAAAVLRWRENRAAIADLAIEPAELARRLEIAEHEASEIAAAHLRAGEAAELEARLDLARHGETIASGVAALRETIAGDGSGAREGLAVAAREARQLGRVDARFLAVAERLEGTVADLDDLGRELPLLADEAVNDAGAIDALQERRSLIYRLERRYGGDEAEVLAHGSRAMIELERLRGVEIERARRVADDAGLLAAVAAAAAELSVRRRTAADRLAPEVGRALEALGFPPSAFEIAIGRRVAAPDEAAVELDGDAVAFDLSGVDLVVFRFAPNAGEPARPLARIASGGEASRVALAIRTVLARADETPTLVFDEIDTGIGGRGADPVGRSLWALGRRHQVVCVTHLPQIAAHADEHFRILKRERDGRTVTEIERLDREGRIVELAAMLAGPGGGAAALAGARELLDRAEAARVRPSDAG
ncbi:MAG: DNA repair protein RecN [Chloroflexi bacterium]|nr:DNA repair protein RecN [Chloroflexota bacterium]